MKGRKHREKALGLGSQLHRLLDELDQVISPLDPVSLACRMKLTECIPLGHSED